MSNIVDNSPCKIEPPSWADEENGEVKTRPSMKGSPKAGLSLVVHRINEDETLTECGLEDALTSKSEDKPSGQYWIDAEVPADEIFLAELREKVLDKLPVSSFLKRHLTYAAISQTRVLSLNKSLLAVLRILPHGQDPAKIRHAVAVAVKGILLTISFFPADLTVSARAARALDIDRAIRINELELPNASISGVFAVWLLFHLNEVSEELHKLRGHIFDLVERADENIGTVSLSEIIDVKDMTMKLLTVAEEQNECLESLANGETVTAAVDFTPLRGFRGLLLQTAAATERTALRLEKRVADLRNIYEAHQQDRINNRLAVLTILSAIFLPLTLMAGIWGMNFDNMPELHRPNSYYFVIASMVLVAVTLLLVFHHRGWLQCGDI
mmetsp:Transcript_5392/g.9506  ORF Transcript_5392/g.9506 Transcript_5392/m.9506 type:complete len:384 (-) Transcript_5392:566-1717(-)|eukprot:CAMPEP_0198304554 /NCGR_PEP_ID=MMETSP1449-20131203/57460_1 /TAXON_ID=420275 /ORGANISM="Attheya septentrionalis, Strain CCMP2084" /LENGTH=383 /DNA_ID=CAMNT_0044007079 /DNA_START=1648 /DNA_END=2799 /DNA_ORIENTATION=+